MAPTPSPCGTGYCSRQGHGILGAPAKHDRVGFQGNPAARGFQNYISFAGWGAINDGRSPKAENLNAVALPELRRLAAEDKPFFLFLRHMDPHSPYLPPLPFERIFYEGDEFDPNNKSMEPVFAFKPFADYFRSWMPAGLRTKTM